MNYCTHGHTRWFNYRARVNNIGLTRKVGEANYGSRGASVSLELELESSLVNDPQRLHSSIRQLFDMTRTAVEEELHRNGQPDAATNGNGHHRQRPERPAPQTTAGSTNGHQASGKQIEYIARLAGQLPGFGPRRLEALAQKMFAKPLAGLTSMDASGLIDMLKAIKAGEVDLEKALNGAAT
jgi:hypothetical protein